MVTPPNRESVNQEAVNKEIRVVQAEAMSLAVVRVETNAAELAEQIERAFSAVYAAVSSGTIQESGRNVIVYRQTGNGEVEVECGVQVPGRFEDLGEGFHRETPAGRAATITHRGPYDRVGEAHAALAAWVRGHGLRSTGVFWEVYGDWNEDPQELRVDIFHQVEEEAL